MSEAQVVPFHKDGEQLVLDGFPIEKGRTRFSLTNDKGQNTDQVLEYNQHVSGTWAGRVKGLDYREVKLPGGGVKLHGTFIVEVLSVDLG